MSLGLPEFGDISVPPFNPLIYPRRVLLAVLENFFSQTNLVIYPGAPTNPFLYIPAGSETSVRSKVVIADSFSDELTKSDPRPTVVLGRGTFQFNDMAIDARRDNMATKMLTRIDTKAIGTENRTRARYSDMTTMGIDIKCYSRRDTDADQLAWLVSGVLKFFKKNITDGARIHKISSPVIGPPVVVKADAQHDMFMVPVSVTIHQPMVWQVQNSASPGEIITEITNLSGSHYPRVLSDSSPLSLYFSPSA